jgi:hypothetical protein
MSDQKQPAPARTTASTSAHDREHTLAQSRETWLKERDDRRKQQKATAEQAHGEALQEMRRPKNERM